MTFKKIRHRLEKLRTEPEQTRLQAATIITIAISLILAFIALIVLLPLQLYLK